MTGILITILVIVYIFYKNDARLRRVISWIIIGFIAGSIIFIIADMIYSFYVASHLLPNVEKWEGNKNLCGNDVFRSSFAVIVIYFLLIFIAVVVLAVFLSYIIFRKFKPLLNDCLDSETDVNNS